MTLLREFHGYGVWFATYEYLVNFEMRRTHTPRSDLPNWKIALCGGLAGEVLWLLSHPLDLIKTKMQTDGFGADQHFATMRDAFRHLFYGLGPALLRAMPVSAGTFAT